MRLMEKQPKRQHNNPRPACPTHGDRMKAGSTLRLFTYYYCMERGCQHSAKVSRLYKSCKS